METEINLKSFSRVPVLQPDNTAKIIIDSILHRQQFVTIPKNVGPWITFFNCLPFSCQRLFRDYINKEGNFMNES